MLSSQAVTLTHSVIRGSGRPGVGDRLLPIITITTPPLHCHYHSPSPSTLHLTISIQSFPLLPSSSSFLLFFLLSPAHSPFNWNEHSINQSINCIPFSIALHTLHITLHTYLPQPVTKRSHRKLALTDFRTQQRTESDALADQPATVLRTRSPQLYHSTISERRTKILDEES